MVTKHTENQGHYVPGTSFWSVSVPSLLLKMVHFLLLKNDCVLWELSHNALEDRPVHSHSEVVKEEQKYSHNALASSSQNDGMLLRILILPALK